MQARYPDTDGFAAHDGVRIAYQVFGRSGPAVVLLPTWPIVPARVWKMQAPHLARRCRVVTFDPRGNGASDRPTVPEAYADSAIVADALAVMDAAGVDRAVLVGYCSGTRWALQIAAAAPERVSGIVTIAAAVPHLTPPHKPAVAGGGAPAPSPEWRARMEPASWRSDFPAFVEAHSGPEFMTPEPYSSKLREDLVAWGLETNAEVLLATRQRPQVPPTPRDTAEAEALVAGVRCPLLAIAGTDDRCQGVRPSERLAALTGGELVVLEGGGHTFFARHPVPVNLMLEAFIERVAAGERHAGGTSDSAGHAPGAIAETPFEAPPRDPTPRVRRWTRALQRPRRVLFVSSPIGLGHARRDLAIATELRALRPDVRVEWLTQHPVTRFLEAHGESVHPASELLANESQHIEAEASGHELNVFEAIRRMDEIFVANFMVFHDLLNEEPFDLVIGDEAWDVDHFLFENPELKRVPFAWLTDFVGWLPMPNGGAREAFLAAEMNEEMIARVERFPAVRDRAVFIGDPEDIVNERFGPDLPGIRPWVEAHFDFAGYVTTLDQRSLDSREVLRERLGYGADDVVCVVSVGGSGVGRSLLERAVAAYPLAKARVPALRMVLVTGPRIDPRAFTAVGGLEVHGYLRDLHHHFAACDVALVQGGLTTTMELTAARRPFIHVPIRRHFEQNIHVRHRLERYQAGQRLDFEDATPEGIADAIAGSLDQPVRYRDVANDGAARAARIVADLV
jgi:pimeloyl-ACP methyl ester carboxylesterase/predicted glycosyltransferase